MGILDSKSRILDVILTQEGRRQMAQGDLRVEYASFTDDSTFYKKDLISGSADATQRIYLEASSLPKDQITFEANDAGKLNPFKNIDCINVHDGKIVSSSIVISNSVTTISGTYENMTILSGIEFASTANKLLQSSIDNFKNLQIIGTKNTFLDNEKFELSKNDVTFTITKEFPIKSSNINEQYLTKLEGLISDPRLSNQVNFKFLPPISKKDNVNQSNLLGEYKNLGQKNSLTINDIVQELSYYELHGYCKKLKFDPTSNNNNIISQFFEVSNNELQKLDVIDYGRHHWFNSTTQSSKSWHVFFVGKVFTDDANDDTFIHLFTLVFS